MDMDHINIKMEIKCENAYITEENEETLHLDLAADIKEALPNLNMVRLNQVLNVILEAGATETADLLFLREDDFRDILKPLQCRRIIHHFTTKYKSGTPAVAASSKSNSASASRANNPAATSVENNPAAASARCNAKAASGRSNTAADSGRSSSEAASEGGNAVSLLTNPSSTSSVPYCHKSINHGSSLRRSEESPSAVPDVTDLVPSNDKEVVCEVIKHLRTFPIPTAREESDFAAVNNTVSSSDPSSDLDPFWSHTLDLEFDRLPNDILEILHNGDRLLGARKRFLVQHLIRVIHHMSLKPVKSELSIVAKRVYDDYPQSVGDLTPDGVVNGTGYDRFLKQLIDRNDNVARKSQNLFRTKHLSAISVFIDGSKKAAADRYGRSSSSYLNQEQVLEQREIVQLQDTVTEIGNMVSSTGTSLSYLDPFWSHGIDLQFNKLPLDVLEVLQNGQKLLGSKRRFLVKHLINVATQLSVCPVRAELAVIARRVYDEYPLSITDQVNGSIIGSGYDRFLKQLIDRNDNMKRKNRAGNPALRKRISAVSVLVDTNTRTQAINDHYGCVQYSPDLQPEEAARLESLKSNQKAQLDAGVFSVQTFVLETYPLQRHEINSGTEISRVLSEWPVLGDYHGLLMHFRILTGVNIMEAMLGKVKEMSGKLVSYLTSNNHPQVLQDQNREILAEIQRSRLRSKNDEASIIGLIKLLISYFKEDLTTLFYLLDDYSLGDDLPQDIPSMPVLLCCGESVLLSSKTYLVVDKQVVAMELTSHASAVAALFASYYCFNFCYPTSVAAALEFVQRYFVGINPVAGSRAERATKRKKINHINPKILRLTGAVSEYEWKLNQSDSLSRIFS